MTEGPNRSHSHPTRQAPMAKPRPKSQAWQTAGAIQEALSLHRGGRLGEAEQIYQAILRAEPRHFDALHLYGVRMHQQGRSLEALQLVGKALRANASAPDAL